LRILLDTHIWLWLIAGPAKIGPTLALELKDKENERWLSPISTWEVLVLARKGRLRLREGAADWVAKATSPFHEAPLTHEVELAAVQLSWGRSDPADRFLAATAKVFGLTLATADTKLLGLGHIATLANR